MNNWNHKGHTIRVTGTTPETQPNSVTKYDLSKLTQQIRQLSQRTSNERTYVPLNTPSKPYFDRNQVQRQGNWQGMSKPRSQPRFGNFGKPNPRPNTNFTNNYNQNGRFDNYNQNGKFDYNFGSRNGFNRPIQAKYENRYDYNGNDYYTPNINNYSDMLPFLLKKIMGATNIPPYEEGMAKLLAHHNTGYENCLPHDPSQTEWINGKYVPKSEPITFPILKRESGRQASLNGQAIEYFRTHCFKCGQPDCPQLNYGKPNAPAGEATMCPIYGRSNALKICCKCNRGLHHERDCKALVSN